MPLGLGNRLGFRQQLVLTFTLGILCLALVSSFAIATLSSRTVRAKLLEHGHRVTETFANQSTLALLYFSPDNAVDAAEATLAFPDIQGVAIYGRDHEVLLSKGEDPMPGPRDAPWPHELKLERETADAWYFVAPVYSRLSAEGEDSPFTAPPPGKELIGFVRVVMGKQTLEQMAADILQGNLSVSITLAGVLLLVLLGITTRLTTPLKNLAGIMRRAKLGEAAVQPDFWGPRDIIEMQSAFNTMAGILRAREKELKAARDAALDSARIKGEFAANVSHELRTPLNGVLGMLELLDDMGLTPKQRDYVQVARKSGESLLELIGDILDFSRLDSGKQTLAVVDFRLQEILDDVVSVLASQSQQRGLDLGYVLDQDLPAAFRGDPARIRQVLMNLVGNALKFTERGEVAIDVLRGDETDGGLFLRFEVSDTGIGVAPRDQERIFEAFSQADGSTTREYGGSGLGLAICRQLVEFMGGEIGVESEPSQGSTFWFTIPLQRSSQELTRTQAVQDDVAGLRVLIVDDSSITRRSLEHTLTDWGIEHESATNGHQALDMLRVRAVRGEPFHLALVDEEMPGMRGPELIRQMRADPTLGRVSVVTMTYRSGSRAGEVRPPNVAGSVTKPIRPSVLYDCIVRRDQRPGQAAPEALPASAQQPAARAGNRILVAEDDRASQQVAVGMLERLGHSVVLATTGREALEAVTGAAYDLVLMDCQMPEMDGYQATGQIRAMEPASDHIPIIAMTAHAREDDSQKCLAAGMDGYLSKPLKLDKLHTVLGRWLPSAQFHAEPTRTGPIESERAPAAAPSLDQKVIGQLRSTVGDGFSKMIDFFLEDTPGYLKALEETIRDEDAQELSRVAHCIKGSARNLGANRLAEVCKQLEDLGRAGSTNGAQDLNAELVAEHRLVEAALRRELLPDEVRNPISQDEGPQRVLIVDDDRGMRFALRNVLEADGYETEEAGDGAEAFALCERRMPDLILMDAVMPVLDGFKSCHQIRGLPNGGHVPVLIVTTLEDEQSVVRAFECGATDYIPKPVHFPVMRQRVSRLLRASRAEKHVRQLAYHDPLTGLPNRTLFRERLEELIGRPRPMGDMLALLFLDLDRFKLVNDTLGHDAGDALLKQVAERLLDCLRTDDLVARLGGDEFTVILDGISGPKTAALVAERICAVFSAPFTLMEQEMYLASSVGISLYPVDGTDIGTLIKHADTAMFQAKGQVVKYQFYEHGMEVEVTRRLQLEGDLRRALDRDELVLHYQPQVDLAGGKVVGLEALARWEHPAKGLIPPLDFIPLAEETGLIGPLGEWALHRACVQVCSWMERGSAPLNVAVNVSGRQLEQQDLARTVRKVLDETGLPPSLLELEITESTLMKRAEDVIPTLRQLKEMGIRLAVDDFGTGYSSLSYLKRFPIDTLKVDRSFVRDITTNPDDAAIITAIIALAQSLKLKVVAEGVEYQEQEVFLKEHGCDFMQGYYISKPLAAKDFEDRILRLGQENGLPSAKVYTLHRPG